MASAESKPKDVWVVVSMTIEAAKWEAFYDEFKPLIATTRKETGCLKYGVHLDAEQKADVGVYKFTLLEHWSSMENLDAHLEMEHMKAASGLCDKYKTSPTLSKLAHELHIV